MTDNQHKDNNNTLEKQLINRGCQLEEPYNTGQHVLSCGRCKLSQFDWLKDYENQEVNQNVRQQGPLPTSQFFPFKQKFFLSLFSAVLGLCCHTGFSLVAASGGCSRVVIPGFSLRWLLSLQSTGSRVHRLQ